MHVYFGIIIQNNYFFPTEHIHAFQGRDTGETGVASGLGAASANMSGHEFPERLRQPARTAGVFLKKPSLCPLFGYCEFLRKMDMVAGSNYCPSQQQ
jgi:hypothetical protein